MCRQNKAYERTSLSKIESKLLPLLNKSVEKTILCNAHPKQKKTEKIRAKWHLEVYQGGEYTVRILGRGSLAEALHCLHFFTHSHHCHVPRETFVCINTQSIFPSRKHDSYSESCPREEMSPVIKLVLRYDAWQTSTNFADLFLFFLEAVYVLSQPLKPRACLSVCVPLVYAPFKQGSAFPQRHFAVKIIL